MGDEQDIKKPKEKWDKLDIVFKASIPIVIFLITLFYNHSQQEINNSNIRAQNLRDAENRKADRLTTLIKHLASENPRERTIAIDVANILALHEQLPAEVRSTIVAASKSSNRDEARAAKGFVKVQSSVKARDKDNKSQAPDRPDGQRSSVSDENTLIYPVRNGDDVLVPQLLINAIPMFDDQKTVYAANDINGWLVSGRKVANPEALRLTTMKKEGNNWRAYKMAGKRFHPAQLMNTDLPDPFTPTNVGWAKIENVYKLSDPFVDLSGSGPCLLVK
jgi:hypothetical protein